MNDTEKYGLRFLNFDDEAAGILAYSVDGGQISEADAAPIWQRFEAAKAADKKIRIYAEMSALPSVSGGLIVEKFKHIGSHPDRDGTHGGGWRCRVDGYLCKDC